MNPGNIRPALRAAHKPSLRPSDYTEAEEAALRRLFPAATRAEILAALPGRNWKAIQRAATGRNIARPRRPHTVLWEGKPIEVLRARYATEGALAVAKALGFTRAQVNSKACAEGLACQVLVKKRPAKRAPRRTPDADQAAREARLKKLYPKSYKTIKLTKTRKPKAVATPKPAPAPPPVRRAAPMPTTEHDPRPKASNTLKPMQTSKVRLAEPVKRSPNTPNLNAQKAGQQALKKPTPLADVLADMKHPQCPPARRLAFTVAAHQGMPAAIKAWDEWPSQQQAA